MKTHEFSLDQWPPAPCDEFFTFFADAAKLQKITRPCLDFRIATPQPLMVRVGALIITG